MKFKNKKPIISLSILSGAGLILALVSGLVFSINHIGQVEAQTLPTNVNVNDLNDAQVNAYYSGVSGLSGDNLVAALNGIIDDHREYDYESDRTAYKIIDRNWELSPLSPSQLSSFNYTTDNPFIRKFYADYNDSALTADRFKNDGASRVSFDKEHLWAQSLGAFGRTGGAGSDFHSLVPADTKGNQQMHSNYNFATPTSGITNYTNDYDTYVGRAGYISGGSKKACEPLDEYKGDIARAMFYMPTRYYTYEDILHPKLTLVNGSPAAVTASSSQPGLAGDLETLLEWNELDPVDEYEIHRNNLIYNNFQLNRNPFIDHPEWARIAFDTSYSGSGASIAPESSSVGSDPYTLVQSISLNATSLNMNLYEEYTLKATITPINAGNKTLTWESTNESVATVSSSGIVESLAAGNTTITATANDGSGIYASCTVVVSNIGKKLESISVSGASSSTPFGSEYSTSSIVVTAHYDDTSYEVVTNDAIIGTPNTSVLGEQAIIISYQNKTTSFTVSVTNNGSTPYLNLPGTASDLFISEYVEGSSGTNKAIEVYNGTGQAVDLSNYVVKLGTNGAAFNNSVSLDGLEGKEVLNDDDTLVIYNDNSIFSNIVDNGELVSNGVMNFNGDDAVGLFKNGSLIDIIGVEGRDPGTSWTTTNYPGALAGGTHTASTADRTLRRTETISSPNATFTWSEWEAYGDTDSNLGSHIMDAPPQITDLNQANAWAEYFLAETSSQCEVLEPQNEYIWLTLGSEYNWMSSTARGYYSSGETATINAAIARYNAIINAHPENVGFISGLSAANTGTYTNQTNDFAFLIFAIIVIGTGILFIAFNRRKSER